MIKICLVSSGKILLYLTPFISSDFNTTSKTGGWKQPPIGGQAKPEPANATSFNWWLFTHSDRAILSNQTQISQGIIEN
jgi:hypothetical protein